MLRLNLLTSDTAEDEDGETFVRVLSEDECDMCGKECKYLWETQDDMLYQYCDNCVEIVK